jgi:hypothetical protein
MESIMFAIHWKDLGEGDGGKRAKGEFYQALYEQQPEHQKVGLKKFKDKYGKIVTYRNYLMELYDCVSTGSTFASPRLYEVSMRSSVPVFYSTEAGLCR